VRFGDVAPIAIGGGLGLYIVCGASIDKNPSSFCEYLDSTTREIVKTIITTNKIETGTTHLDILLTIIGFFNKIRI
jgi:hypothetical protein